MQMKKLIFTFLMVSFCYGLLNAQTIGNTAEGTLIDLCGGSVNSIRYQCSQNMTVTKIYAKIGTSGTGLVKCAIYADNSGVPGSFLRGTNELTNPGTGWKSFDLTSGLSLTSGTWYHLALWANNTGYGINYTSGGVGTPYRSGLTYGAWPNPFGTTAPWTNGTYCLYATTSCTNPSITSQPQSITRAKGASATFSVTASGTSLTYQWKKGGANISGATSTSYTISSVERTDAGNYTVVVSGACGSPVTSNTATLTVSGGASGSIALLQKPGMHDPQYGLIDALETEGYTVDTLYTPFNFTTLGTYDMVIISRTVNSSDFTAYASWNALDVPVLVLSSYCVRDSRMKLINASVVSTPDGSQVSTGLVTDGVPIANGDGSYDPIFNGVTTGSTAFEYVTWFYDYLDYTPADFVTDSNTGKSLVKLASDATVGAGNILMARWDPNTIAYSGAGTHVNYRTYMNLGADDNLMTHYNMDSYTTQSLTLFLNEVAFLIGDVSCTNPSITSQPQSITRTVGTSATFTVTASGTSLTYQWKKNGGNLTGATSSSYTISSVASGDAGNYTVVVSGACGSPVTSSTAVLTVCTTPSITSQPQSLTRSVGQSATFTVTATGTTLTYQWRKNGGNLTGATSSSYTISSVATGDAGNYTVVVSGACGSPVTSSTAVLTVTTCTNPSISSQPQSLTRKVGTSATFTVTASGTSLTYQWKKNGGNISGATSSSYTISSPALSSAGNYTVVVSGACGTPVTSNVAALIVANYFLSPSGSDSNDGSPTSPFFTLNKVWTVVSAGNLVYMRGGTYYYNSRQSLSGKNGTSSDTIKIFAYPGEYPAITKSGSYSTPSWPAGLIYLQGSYTYWKGLEIKGYTQATATEWYAMVLRNSNNNRIERINSHHNGHGFCIRDACTNNLVLNCDFHHNYDPLTSYGNADGIEVAYLASSSQNTLRGCRMWNNSDDGLDLWDNDGNVIVDGNWSYHNGYREDGTTQGGDGGGLKLGKTVGTYSTTFKRTLTNNLVFQNRSRGINQNSANCKVYVINNTVYGNGTSGIDFYSYNLANVFRNNACFSNATNWTGTHTNAIIDHNSYDASWQPTGPVASSADFLSLDSTGVSGPRQANGSLPNLNFLKLKLSPLSDLVGAGVAITTPYSIAYTGPHPDLGAYESSDASQSAYLVDQPTGYPELINDKDLFVVYPNPVKDKLTISLNDKAQVSIKLYNSKGIKLYEGIAAGTTTLDMSSYAPGLYIMHVEIGGELKVAKIIK